MAAWVLLIQGIGLVCTALISWWFLRYTYADVAAAVRHYPAYADQASHVRDEIAAANENQLAFAFVLAPLFVVPGIGLLRKGRLPRGTIGALTVLAVIGCVCAGVLNFMSLSGNEPLLEHVTPTAPGGDIADLAATNSILVPLSALAAAALLASLPTTPNATTRALRVANLRGRERDAGPN